MSEADWQRPTALHKAELVGQRLGNYVVRALVGAGGMGEVYAAEQPEIGKKVAIKVLKAAAAIEPELVERMLAEARAVNAIGHPNIVDVFDFGRLSDGRSYLVMDWLDGEPLDALVRRGPLPAGEVIELLAELCAPLAAAHAKGIVHRDLKPPNIFVGRPSAGVGPQVKLLDFGLARSIEPGRERLTRAGLVVGTPDYLSPEQATGSEELGPAADLYAVGVIGFELLTGELPFAGGDAREVMSMKVQQAPPRASSRIEGVPPELDQLVFELMATEPGDRPASAEEVRQRLLRLKTAGPSLAIAIPPAAMEEPDPLTEPGAQPPPPRPPPSRWLSWLVIGGSAIAALSVVSVFVGNRDAPVIAPPPPTPIAHPVEALPPPEVVVPPPPPAPAPRPEAPAGKRRPSPAAKKPATASTPREPGEIPSNLSEVIPGLYGGLDWAEQTAIAQHPLAVDEIKREAQAIRNTIPGVRSQKDADEVRRKIEAFPLRF